MVRTDLLDVRGWFLTASDCPSIGRGAIISTIDQLGVYSPATDATVTSP